MNCELMVLIRKKRELWYKCLNCRFNDQVIVEEYKNFIKSVKLGVAQAIRD